MYACGGLLSAFGQYGFGDQSPHSQHAKRYDDQVVEVADDGDGVGNEIDWAQGVGDDACGQEFGVPGRAGVAHGKKEGEHFFAQGSGLVLESLKRIVGIGAHGPVLY